jgi:hypothetical protein
MRPAVLVGVVGEPEKDQLEEDVAAAHGQTEHERRGFDSRRLHPGHR